MNDIERQAKRNMLFFQRVKNRFDILVFHAVVCREEYKDKNSPVFTWAYCIAVTVYNTNWLCNRASISPASVHNPGCTFDA